MSMFDQVFEVSGKSGDLEYRIQTQMVGPMRYIQRHIFSAPEHRLQEWIPSLASIFNDIRVRGKEINPDDN